MVKLQKYLFDQDFGPPRVNLVEQTMVMDPDEEEQEPEPPPPPTFSEEELALAREQSFEAGREAGLAEAQASQEQMLAMAMSAAAHHLQTIGAAQAEANEAMLKEGVAVALAVLKKLHPEFARRFALAEIEEALLSCLHGLEQAARLKVKVRSELVGPLKERVDALAASASFEGKLVVSADDTLAPGDCHVEWSGGGADRDQAAIWADVDKAVEAALAIVAGGTNA